MYRFLRIGAAALFLCLFFPCCVLAAPRLQETEDKIVIVIDPGHGGGNQGTTENYHVEKYMTMTTALAMYEELSLYDNVEVYLTRTEDLDISLKKRAEYAKSVDADYMFSIHYNASANNELFGSEVWVSAFAPYNAYGYQFGSVLLTDMRELGLLARGVKTRLGDKGLDYYGIIRESVNLEVPAVIIEHCHVDEPRDAVFCDSDEKLKEFGRLDATAVAKYFGLKSKTLEVDYSDFELAEASADTPAAPTVIDATKPEVCQIEFLGADYENGFLSLTVTAADYDGTLLYYSYSTNGGYTFSQREVWPGSDTLTGRYSDTFTLNLNIQPGTAPDVIVRAYNIYDLYTESNLYESPRVFPDPAEEPDTESVPGGISGDHASSPDTEEPEQAEPREKGNSARFVSFLLLCLTVASIMLVLVIISQFISRRRRKKRRLQQRKDVGKKRYQHK